MYLKSTTVSDVCIVHPESFRTQSAFEFCNFLCANAFCVLIKPVREHAHKRTHARNCVSIYACERTQTHADPSACVRTQIQVHERARTHARSYTRMNSRKKEQSNSLPTGVTAIPVPKARKGHFCGCLLQANAL